MKWTRSQRNSVMAAYLGWTLDAFDFFLMVFMFKDIALEFHSNIQVVSTAVLLTLAARPLGALVFGRLADRFGRKPTLVWNILAYSLLEMVSGVCAEHDLPFDRAGLVRRRDGGRVGYRIGAGDGVDTGRVAGRRVGNSTSGLSVGLFPGIARHLFVL